MKDSKIAFDSAKAITGGRTLADVYTAILTGQGKGKVLDVNNVSSASFGGRTWSEIYKGNKQINKASFLDTSSNKRTYEMLIKENGLKAGDSFILNGVKYNVKGPGSIVRDESYKPPTMWGGGRFAAKQAITINDRTNSLGTQYEGIKFDRSGVVYPNAATMPQYDIPSYSTSGGIKQGGKNSSSSNVTINATLNFGESPKNGRELWKEFQQIAKAEGAKIGENIVIGRSA